MLMSRALVILLLFLLASTQCLSAQASSPKEETAQLLARLESGIPSKPAVVEPEIVLLMEQAGSTKRLDAAVLLIRALAFNWSPSGSNESKSLMEMLPAAPILIRHYGPAVLPLLMYAGVTAEQGWMQKRIALVIQGMGRDQEVSQARVAFSMKDSARPAAKRFGELLEARDLKIELADPAREALEDLDRRVRGVKPPR